MTRARDKVLLAMSGGVDSSVAAALLLRAGYDVVGCFMRLGSPGETLETMTRDEGGACTTGTAGVSGGVSGGGVKVGHQGCCSINDAADARQVAAELGIPFYVVNFKRDFGRVISYFVDEYVRGRTPNPCVRCNDWLKFGKLHDYAVQIGATHVASGHYARIDREGTSPRLMRGVDHSKDQSYVLFGAPRERLASMLLPIGEMEKPRVRDLARELGLPVFDKPDSQEICFVPDNDYAGLVERVAPEQARPGPIVNERGEVVGTHAGQHRFTVGQRRGVKLALGTPAYVLERDAATNTVRIGPPEALDVGSLIASEANWLTDPPAPGQTRVCLARYRSNGRAVPARVRTLAPLGADQPSPSGRHERFEVVFEEPQRAVAPGQAVVLYDASEPDWVIGGGWIASVT
ncbi:MAG: tRNA 2-thiouridine(34) synthase MnmA [Phycisphaeraceae bacterium]|nr:tRNA 2-thiouridine(34) synthase MnmA [Phycisphaeraceae bacterium]